MLRFVTLKRRLTLCALVHSSWRAAATEATTKLILMKDRISSGSLSAWLQSQSSRLTEISITRVAGPFSACSRIELLQLPVPDLKDLQQLRLLSVAWRPAESAGQQPLQRRTKQPLPSLSNLTALTSLDLAGASVQLDGLEALTGLKRLSLGEVRPGPHLKAVPAAGVCIPQVDRAAAVLAAALPQLQHLESVNLQSSICSTAVLAQISTLQHLEQLTLNPSAPTSLPPLPQSLTSFSATRLRVGSASGLTRLTCLQELNLRESNLDSAVLAGMSRLRVIDL